MILGYSLRTLLFRIRLYHSRHSPALASLIFNILVQFNSTLHTAHSAQFTTLYLLGLTLLAPLPHSSHRPYLVGFCRFASFTDYCPTLPPGYFVFTTSFRPSYWESSFRYSPQYKAILSIVKAYLPGSIAITSLGVCGATGIEPATVLRRF